MEDTVARLSLPGPEIIAVYRYDPPDYAFIKGDFVIVATVGFGEAPVNVGGVFVGDGGIAGFSRGCSLPLEQFIEGHGLTERIDLGAPPTLPSTGSRSSANGGALGVVILVSVAVGVLGGGAAASRMLTRRT